MPTRTVGDRLRLLLAMIPWLVSVGGAATSEVAERFGLTEDEVVQMLEMAACCGLPPYTPDVLMELLVSDGWVSANLGIQLTRPQRLTASEGFTLAASARAILAVPGADPEGALARALAKLEGVLGARIAVEVDDPPLLEVVRRSVQGRESLEITYYSESRDELTERRVDPTAVFVRDGHWYLDGWCHMAGGRRLFRVDRMRSAVPGGERIGAASPSAASPSADSPSAAWPPTEPTWREVPIRDQGPVPEAFVPGPEARVVTLLVPVGDSWVVESYPTLSSEPAEDGRLRVTLAVGGLAWLERLLLRLGPDAQVLDPPDLAALGSEAAARLLRMYGRDSFLSR
jgi:proteasome accessory factor C